VQLVAKEVEIIINFNTEIQIFNYYLNYICLIMNILKDLYNKLVYI